MFTKALHRLLSCHIMPYILGFSLVWPYSWVRRYQLSGHSRLYYLFSQTQSNWLTLRLPFLLKVFWIVANRPQVTQDVYREKDRISLSLFNHIAWLTFSLHKTSSVFDFAFFFLNFLAGTREGKKYVMHDWLWKNYKAFCPLLMFARGWV